MGPAVGANALTMGGAIAIAAVCETAGALLAGGDVVSTISGGIVAPESLADQATFIWAMMAALIAGERDPDVLAYGIAAALAAYYFRAPLLRCFYCCCRVRIRQAKIHETKDLDV